MTIQKSKISSSKAFAKDLKTGQELEHKVLQTVRKKIPQCSPDTWKIQTLRYLCTRDWS